RNLPFSQIYTGHIVASEEILERRLFRSLKEKIRSGPLASYDLLGANEIDKDLISKLNIELGKKPGRQVQTSVGMIDFLVYNKEQNQLLVIELRKKRGGADPAAQLLRYTNYLKQEVKIANLATKVKGCIITHGENQNILCALEAIEDLDYYRYEASDKKLSDFNLIKVEERPLPQPHQPNQPHQPHQPHQPQAQPHQPHQPHQPQAQPHQPQAQPQAQPQPEAHHPQPHQPQPHQPQAEPQAEPQPEAHQPQPQPHQPQPQPQPTSPSPESASTIPQPNTGDPHPYKSD
ncbi:MAG: endonuclease NucS, partial [Proteobacteria bacterium]|nr:endonuclease NucS [Pseudomonadota bacterium]